MKLSEAILLGSVGSEQGFGVNSVLTNSPTKCVMGAALHAVGINVTVSFKAYSLLPEAWPWVNQVIDVPIIAQPQSGAFLGDATRQPIWNVLWMLNDIARWTRPQVAAWVAELEQMYDKQPEVTNQEVECEVK